MSPNASIAQSSAPATIQSCLACQLKCVSSSGDIYDRVVPLEDLWYGRHSLFFVSKKMGAEELL
ncbi:uncharacterized protein N7529_008535 [Penicillium soppii]|uniref:uncharacterized protein n=1 Tax=Penicillium soppii TaxID=69789 RepID=UPI0025487354|nr:uncharacterized protein N7529_008535 [Penicillium soppii]KAJ5861225.1 hypothetical protein N7529_008535 [Penicillium soppii]